MHIQICCCILQETADSNTHFQATDIARHILLYFKLSLDRPTEQQMHDFRNKALDPNNEKCNQIYDCAYNAFMTCSKVCSGRTIYKP